MPDTESLATTLDRVLPYWEKVISPDIKDGKKVLVGPGSGCSGRFCIGGRRVACVLRGWVVNVHVYVVWCEAPLVMLMIINLGVNIRTA